MIKQYEMPKLDKNGKVYLCMPRERVYIPAFVDNRDEILYELQKTGQGIGYYQAEGHRVDRNRDMICEHFLEHEKKPEWLIMIDTDMDHPRTLPERLTRWEKPIVGGLYFHRGEFHDPFAFKVGPDTTDKYGRAMRQWRPMREEVYRFIIDHNLPMRDGPLIIDECKYSPLVEVDAVATGAICIHRSVLETMKQPYFEYKDGGASEDLTFCADAKELYGIPIYCDFSTMSGHYAWQAMGYAQFRLLYEGRGVNMSNYSKTDSIKWVSEFLGVSEELAKEKIELGNAHMVGDYWNSKFKNRTPSPEEIREFYKDPYTGELYLIELLHWNFEQFFYQIRSQFLHVRWRDVLEIGAGIGTIAIQLALQGNRVTACETNQFLRDFIKYRIERTSKEADEKIDVEIIDENGWQDRKEHFQSIFAVDVFEHLPEKEVRKMLHDIHDTLVSHGQLGYHANFGQLDIYPMHFDHSDKWGDFLDEANILQIGQFEAIKAD